jgi:hypothetical protein
VGDRLRGIVGPCRPNRAQPCLVGPCLAGPSLAGLAQALPSHAVRAEGRWLISPCRAVPSAFGRLLFLSGLSSSFLLCAVQPFLIFLFALNQYLNRCRQSAGRPHKKGGGLWPPPSTPAMSCHVKPCRALTTLAGHDWPHQALSSPAMRAKPGRAKPGRAEPSRAGLALPSRAQPTRPSPSEPCRPEPSRPGPCRTKPRGPCLALPSPAKPGHTLPREPNQARPSPALPRTVRRKGLDQTVAHPGPDRGKKKERTKSPMSSESPAAVEDGLTPPVSAQ